MATIRWSLVRDIGHVSISSDITCSHGHCLIAALNRTPCQNIINIIRAPDIVGFEIPTKCQIPEAPILYLPEIFKDKNIK